MSTTAIAVNGEAGAWEFIAQALEGKYDNNVIELEFDNWPQFHINIKGDRYNSTLPASLMKSLVDLQGHLYRVYADLVYGKSAKALSDDERKALEIVFKVEQGSSNVVADLSGFFTELGKSAMEKMTGTQVITAVLGVAALWTGASTYNAYLDDKQKALEEQNRHAVTMKLMEAQPKLAGISNEHAASYNNILKSVPDATRVTLGETQLNRLQVEAITKQERKATELTRIDDKYLITSLKIKPDSYRIEVLRVSDERTFPTELMKGYLTMAEMDQITKAFTSEVPINLKVLGRVRGDVITTANIIGIKEQTPVDTQLEVSSDLVARSQENLSEIVMPESTIEAQSLLPQPPSSLDDEGESEEI